MITDSNHIVPAFHFRVVFAGLKGMTEADTSFESVSGIQGVLPGETNDTDTGNSNKKNNFTAVFQPVILRRAVVLPQYSALFQWVIQCLNNPVYNTLPQVLVEVLNEEHQPVIIIKLKDVSLKSWSLGELHAQKSGLLMEEIWLNYKAIEIPAINDIVKQKI